MNLVPLDPAEIHLSLKKKQNLPTLPTTFVQLLNVTSDPKSSFLELATIIAYDPSLTANVLRVANSSYIGLKQPAEDLSSAIICLGVFEIRRTALAVGFLNLFIQKGSSDRFLKDIWIHSLATGFLSQQLASMTGFDYESAYIAGLLHDIGKLFFATSYPKAYASLLGEVAQGKEKDILSREEQIFGMTHLDAAQELCAHWKLPNGVLQISRDHHNPTMASPETLPLSLSVATSNILAHQIIADEPVTHRLPQARQWLEKLIAQSSRQMVSMSASEIEATLMKELTQIQCYQEVADLRSS